MSFVLSLIGKLASLRLWQWGVVLGVLFLIYCVWCLWLATRIEAEIKKVESDAKADASRLAVWFHSILVRLHFAKAPVAAPVAPVAPPAQPAAK